MRGFVLSAMVLAACSADGIVIEVRVPAGTSVDQVDLYLATSGCDRDRAGFDCTGIVPKRLIDGEARPFVEGEVFFVDDNLPFFAPVDADGSAWFELAPSAQVAVKTAIAVGHDPTLGNTGVAILKKLELVDASQHIRVDLRPVESPVVLGTAAPAVEIWNNVDDPQRCVAADVDGRVVYIVPESDPDCDQLQINVGECEPGVHLAQEPISPLLEDQECSFLNPTSLCLLGDRACDETQKTASEDGRCVQSSTTYCVPDKVCECPDLDDFAACIPGLFADPVIGGGTHLVCFIETEADGAGFRTCVNDPVKAVAIGNGVCGTPTIALALDQLAGFSPSVTSTNPTGDVELQPTTEGGCNVGFVAPNATFTGPIPLAATRALVKLDLTKVGDANQRFLILPAKISFTAGDCQAPTESGCQLVRSPVEHFDQCFL